MANNEETVSHWISQVQAGDADGAQRLWERYYEKLARLALRQLGSANRRVSDEEDVVISAFESFCAGAKQGRFPQLADRNELWGLLVTITQRKTFEHLKHARRLKRGGGKVRGESALRPANEDAERVGGFGEVVDGEPTPAFAVELAEQLQSMLDELDDPLLTRIALLKLEGYTNEEIANQLQKATRTVERKLRLIRMTWSGKNEP